MNVGDFMYEAHRAHWGGLYKHHTCILLFYEPSIAGFGKATILRESGRIVTIFECSLYTIRPE